MNYSSVARFFLSAAVLSAALPVIAAAQQPQRPPSPVTVTTVERTDIVPTVPVTGTVYSRNELQVTLGVDGRLLFVAEPGTTLSPGDLVANIDTGPLELQRAEQQAQTQRAKAQLRFLNAQLERQRDLLRKDSTSANQLEQTESDRDVAASDLRIAELRIAQIDDQLRRAEVRAPFAGVVLERLRREGEDVARGTVLARITDISTLEVRVYAPLRYAGRVHPGDELRIFGFESEHTGSVRAVVPSADMRSQTFELRIDLPETAPENWVIGQLLTVAIPMRSAESVLAVHRDALILRQDGTYMFRVDDDGVAHRVRIETGDSAGDLVAVIADLAEGDRVVVRGAETLTDGQPVNVLNGDGNAALTPGTEPEDGEDRG